MQNEKGPPFIYEHRNEYNVGLNYMYNCIHDFKPLYIFIGLLISALELLEPNSEIIGFLF